jgi:predicted unusual protein kinase regulating ubiquinone biosynthesis (AarF/ABC1/UbiB family)
MLGTLPIGWTMADDDRSKLPRVRGLVARLRGSTGTEVPTSAFGRARRTAAAAIRTGAGVLAGRFRGLDVAGLAAADPKTIERLVLSLGELKGIAMKVGQILSYIDDTLPEETRQLLSLLQVHSQPTAFSEIETILRADFGPRADALLATLERAPIASASVGQVHRARLADGTDVAVKVRHPGIESAIAADFRSAQIGRVLVGLLAPGSNVDQVAAEAKARFLEECDYAVEQRRQRRFGTLFANDASINVPAVHPAWSSGRVLTTTWQDGRGLDSFVEHATQAERDGAGRALYEFYIGTLYRHGLFNADPHPGNLLFQDDRRIAVLDHGCVREFDRETVAAIIALSRAVREEDDSGMREALQLLGAKDPEPGPELEATRELMRGFYAPILGPGKRRLKAGVNLETRNVMKSKRDMLRLRIPGRLLFLFRIRFGLYSVLARLGAELDWQALEIDLANQFHRFAPSD